MNELDQQQQSNGNKEEVNKEQLRKDEQTEQTEEKSEVTAESKADANADTETDSEVEMAGSDPEEATETDETAESSEATSSEAIAKLEQEIADLKTQLEEQHQRMLRIQADYDNFRRRTREEKEQMRKYASLPLLENLLPFIDNFERALISSKEHPDFDALLKGLDMIYDQLKNILEQEGLKVIEAVGQPFNPEYHQAVMQVEDDEYDEGIIVEELQKGYQLIDRVIRPSMVKVNK